MADLSNYLKQQYASTLQAELSELEKAYKQNTNTLDKTAQELPQQYEAQRNQIAATNALEKQAFDERANAMGLNTGTSGQAQLARSSVYQRDLAGIGAAEANAMNDLALQRSQLQAEYESAMAKAKADSDAALNNALYAEMVRQQELAAARAAAAAAARPVYVEAQPKPVPTNDTNGRYTLGEMLDVATAGASKATIEQLLANRGVDTSNKYVQADIKWAMSK